MHQQIKIYFQVKMNFKKKLHSQIWKVYKNEIVK